MDVADKQYFEMLSGVDGNGNAIGQGGQDPFTTVNTVPGSPFTSATVGSGMPGGYFFSGGTACSTKSQQITTSNTDDIQATFRRMFELPGGFDDAVLRLWIVVDDGARVSLNGNDIAVVDLLAPAPDGSIVRRSEGFPQLVEVRQENCAFCFHGGANLL